jgi:hypothetical protein
MLKGMPVLLIILIATSARAQTNLLDKLTEPFKRNSAVTEQQVNSDSEPRPATATPRRHHSHYSRLVHSRMIQRRLSVSAENVMAQQEVDINWEVDSTPVLYTSPLFNDLALFEDAWFAYFNKSAPPEDSVWPGVASLQPETLQQDEDVHQVDHAGRSAAAQGFVLAAGSATGLALGMWMFVFRRRSATRLQAHRRMSALCQYLTFTGASSSPLYAMNEPHEPIDGGRASPSAARSDRKCHRVRIGRAPSGPRK